MLLNHHHHHSTSHLIGKADNNKNNLKPAIQNPLQSSRMTGTITATKSSSNPKPATTTASTQAQQKSVMMNSQNKYGDQSINPVSGCTGKMVNGPTISFGSSATNPACLTKQQPIQKPATVVAAAAASATATAVAKTEENKNVDMKISQISSMNKDSEDSKSGQSTNQTLNSRKRKLPLLNDINEMITCALCSGYFIDATTIVECLDTFCKSCIVNYLETSKSCPICDVPLSKIKPHQSLRHDKLKQSLVYKLAPQVFIDEMKRRREFYQRLPETGITSAENGSGSDATVSLEPFSKEDGGMVPIHSYYFRPNDKISMSLEYLDGPVIPNQQQQSPFNFGVNPGPSMATTTTTTVNKKPTRSSRTMVNDNSKTKKDDANFQNDENFVYIPPEDKPKRRYLLCPAALTILQLKKLISNKFGEFETFSEFKIEIYYAGQLLKDDFTLMEVAYIYTWGANDPMRFSYCFVRKRPKTQLRAIENSIEEPSSSQQSLGRSLRPTSSSTSTSNHQNSTSTTTTTRSTSLTRGGSDCQNSVDRNSNSSSSILNRSTSSSCSSVASPHHLASGTSSSNGNSQKRIAITNPIQKVSVSNSLNNSRVIIQREYGNYHPGEMAQKRPKLMVDDDAEFTHTGTQTLLPTTNSNSSSGSQNSVSSVPTTTTTVRITTTTTSSAVFSVQPSTNSAVSTKTSFSALSSPSTITVSRKKNGDLVAKPSLDNKDAHQHAIKRSASNNISGTKEMNQPIALKTTAVSESTIKPTIIKLFQKPVTMVKDSVAATDGSNKKEVSSNHHHHHHHHSSHHHHHHHHHHGKDSNVGGQQQKLSTSSYSVQNLINNDNSLNQNKKITVVKSNQSMNNAKSSSSPIISSGINTLNSNGKDSGGGSKTPSHPLSPPAIRIKLTTSPNSSPSQLIGQIISPIPPEVQNELKSVSSKSSESPKHKSSGSNSNSSINAPQGYKMVTSQGVQSSSTSANSSSSATAAAAATATATTSSTTSTSTASTTTSAANSKSGGRGKGIHDIINKMASQKSNFKSSCLKPFGSSTTAGGGNGNVQADDQQPQQQQPHSPPSSSFEELINAKKSLDIEKTTSLTITTSKLIDSSAKPKEQSQQQQQQQSTATKSSGNLVLRISRKPQIASPTSNTIDDSETSKSDCSNASVAAEIKQTKEKLIISSPLSCSAQLNLGDDDDDDDENSIEPKLVVDMDHDDEDDEDEDAIDSDDDDDDDDDDDETRTMLLIDDQCENDSGRGSSTSSEISAKVSESSAPVSKSGVLVLKSIASTTSSKSISSLDTSPLSVSAILTSTSPTISPRNSITLDVDTCKTVSAAKSSLASTPTIKPRGGTFLAPLDLSSKKSPPRSNINKSGQSPSSRTNSPGAVSPAHSPTRLLVPSPQQQCSESSPSSSAGKTGQPQSSGLPWHMYPKRPKSLASKIVPPLPPSMILPKMSPMVSPPATASLSNVTNHNSSNSSLIIGNKSSQRSNKASTVSVGGIEPMAQSISTSQASSSSSSSSGTGFMPFGPSNFPFAAYDPFNSVMGMAAFMYNQHPALKSARTLSSNQRYQLMNRGTNSSSLSLNSIPSNLMSMVNGASGGNTNNSNTNNNNMNMNTSNNSNNLKRFMEREPSNRPMKCANNNHSSNNTSRAGQSGGSGSHNKNGNLFGSSSSSLSGMVSNNSNNPTKSPTLINNRQQPKSSPSSSSSAAAAAAGSIPSSSSTFLQQQRNLSSSSTASSSSSSSSSTTSTQYQPVFPH